MKTNVTSQHEKKGYDLAYELSYQIACQEFRSTPDILMLCRKTGADWESQGEGKVISLRFVGEQYSVSWPEVEITASKKKSPVPIREKLLILHYLNTSKGTPVSGRAITFRELPAGQVYFPTYIKRAVNPFVEAFTADPDRLLQVATKLGGHEGVVGDVSAVIEAFPRVSLTYVLWKGDSELSTEGNILYDANITDYLPIEDITILTESITWRMVRL